MTIMRIESGRLRRHKWWARWDTRLDPATSGRTDTGIFADRAGCGRTGIGRGRLIRALCGCGRIGRRMGGVIGSIGDIGGGSARRGMALCYNWQQWRNNMMRF
jgi:hypothetical protein